MTKIAVLIPVLDRPHLVEPLLASLAASQATIGLTPIFLCSTGDEAEVAAIRAQAARHVIVPWEAGDGDYARKLNLGYTIARDDFPWVFLAADDLKFRRGWAEAALRQHESTGACVIGTNDLGNSRVIAGHHSTHSLIHADYHECGTIDEDDRILHESYGHEFCDDELVQTAIFRGTFAFARDAIVEHMHPDWRKGEWDATYEKGRSHRNEDRDLYQSRRHLWGK